MAMVILADAVSGEVMAGLNNWFLSFNLRSCFIGRVIEGFN